MSKERSEELFPVRQQSTAMVETQQSRAMAEVQGMMIIARRFPRDEDLALKKVLAACRRPKLAEDATYDYPRGKEMISGPSIKIAEAVARAWGNIDFGTTELERTEGESSMMAHAWDLETNARQTRQWVVPHERHTKQGSYALTDPRDIYENTANQAARRLRACILGVIPGDIVDAALEQCEETLVSMAKGVPLEERTRKMLGAFATLGVTRQQVEGRIGHSMTKIKESELVRLRRVYSSIKDGMALASAYFAGATVTIQTEKPKTDKEVEPPAEEAPPDPKPEPDPTARRIVNGIRCEMTPDGEWVNPETGEIIEETGGQGEIVL